MSVENLKTLIQQSRTLADQMDVALGDVANTGIAPSPPPPLSNVIRVKVGDDLQKAIDAANPGDTIRVQPGTYPAMALRKKVQGAVITIRPDVADSSLPAPDTRASIDHVDAFIHIQPVNGVGISCDRAAAWWSLQGLHVLSPGQDGTHVQIGAGTETQLADLPHDIVLDRCVLDGAWAAKRGVALNGGRTDILNCSIVGIMKPGQDTQCLAGFNGIGPFNIINNFLNGGTETIIFGGADPTIPNLVPSDIVIRGNTITKDMARMRAIKGTVKNALELKNAQRVLIENNIVEYSWVDGQTGYLLMLTVRNQNGRAPWSTVQDVVIRYNVVRHGNQGISILGLDDIKDAAGVVHPSVAMRNVDIHDNLFYDLDNTVYGGGSTHEMAVNNGPINVSITHNTFVAPNVSAMLGITPGAAKVKAAGLIVRDNVLAEGSYGIAGDGTALGADSWNAGADAASIFDSNQIAKGSRTIVYPGRSVVGPVTFDAGFAATPATIGSDGKPVGADIAEIKRRIPALQLP